MIPSIDISRIEIPDCLADVARKHANSILISPKAGFRQSEALTFPYLLDHKSDPKCPNCIGAFITNIHLRCNYEKPYGKLVRCDDLPLYFKIEARNYEHEFYYAMYETSGRWKTCDCEISHTNKVTKVKTYMEKYGRKSENGYTREWGILQSKPKDTAYKVAIPETVNIAIPDVLKDQVLKPKDVPF